VALFPAKAKNVFQKNPNQFRYPPNIFFDGYLQLISQGKAA